MVAPPTGDATVTFSDCCCDCCGPRFYVEGFGGVTSCPDLLFAFSNVSTTQQIEDGDNFGAAIGTHYNDCVDIEFEYFDTRTNYVINPNPIKAKSLMANVFYNHAIGCCLEGYAGGGLGATQIDYENNTGLPS